MFRAGLALTTLLVISACAPQEAEVSLGDNPCDQGEAYLAEGNSEAAIVALETCLESASLDPGEEAAVYSRLGGALLFEQRYEDALEAFNLAFAIAETNGASFDGPYIRRNRGIARRNVGQLEGALSDLEQARRQLPDDVLTLLNLGGLYADMGRYAEAIAEFDAVTRVEPDWAGGWINLSGALLELGLNDQAIDRARRSVELEPESGFALNALCWALVMDEQYQTALPLCDQAVAAEPENGSIIHSRAAALEGLGRMDEARELYAQAFELSPESETLEADYRRTRQ